MSWFRILFMTTVLWYMPSKGLRISPITTADGTPDKVTFTWTRSQGDPTKFAFGASVVGAPMSDIAFIPTPLNVDASKTEDVFVGSVEGGIQTAMVIVAYSGTDLPFFTGTQTLGVTTGGAETSVSTPSTSTVRYSLQRMLPKIDADYAAGTSDTESTPWTRGDETRMHPTDRPGPPFPPAKDEERQHLNPLTIVLVILGLVGSIVIAVMTFHFLRRRRTKSQPSIGGSEPSSFFRDRMIRKKASVLSRLPGRTPSYRTNNSMEARTLLSSSRDTASTIYASDADSYLESKGNTDPLTLGSSQKFTPLTDRQMKIETEIMALQRQLIELGHKGQRNDLYFAAKDQEIDAVKRDIEGLRSIQEGEWALELTDNAPEVVRLRLKDMV